MPTSNEEIVNILKQAKSNKIVFMGDNNERDGVIFIAYKKGLLKQIVSNSFMITELGISYLDALDFNKDKQIKMPPTHRNNILKRIKSISLSEWGIIVTILGFIITLWVYVINPLIEKYF